MYVNDINTVYDQFMTWLVGLYEKAVNAMNKHNYQILGGWMTTDKNKTCFFSVRSKEAEDRYKKY